MEENHNAAGKHQELPVWTRSTKEQLQHYIFGPLIVSILVLVEQLQNQNSFQNGKCKASQIASLCRGNADGATDFIKSRVCSRWETSKHTEGEQ